MEERGITITASKDIQAMRDGRVFTSFGQPVVDESSVLESTDEQKIAIIGGGQPMSLSELTKNITEEEKKRLEEYFAGDVMSTMSISGIEEMKEPVQIKMSRTEKRKLQRQRAREERKQRKQINTIHKNIENSSN